MRLACGIAYDGSAFHGWQRQTNLPTVQGELERAISTVADAPVTVVASGRTDRAVHALGQVATFDSPAQRDLDTWLRALNGLTPDAISVPWVQPVPDEFHARYSAVARRYCYVFSDAGHSNPLLAQRAWQTRALDVDAMHRAGQLLLGEQDFSAVRGAGCQSLTPVRRVDQCVVRRQGGFVLLEIQANAFLLHMVRNIARLLHDVGRGEPIAVTDLLLGRDRTRLGATAPAQGLYFARSVYAGVVFPLPPPLQLIG